MLSDKELELLNKIQKKTVYEDKFFEKRFELKWFDELRKRGYFNPNPDTRPYESKEKGFFSIPQWNVLPYLEKVSQQVSETGNEKYIDELLAIIREVSNYKDSDDKYIDNYRTWWFFVKILINIPPDKIPIDIVDLIPIWLDSKFNTSLPGADILNKLLPKFLENTAVENNIDKAERIVKHSTALKPSKKPKEEYPLYDYEKFELVMDSYWLEEAFKKYSEIVGKICSEKVIYDLSYKIKKLLQRDENTRLINVANTPYSLKLVKKNESDYLLQTFIIEAEGQPASYEQAFENIVSGKENNTKLINEYVIYATSLNDFVENACVELKKDNIFESYNTTELQNDLFKLYCYLYSEGTYSSFYEESKYGSDKAFDVLTSILKRILQSKALKNIEVTKNILVQYFSDKYFYFPKMALFIIGKTGESYTDTLWEILNTEKRDILLESLFFGDELKYALKNLLNILKTDEDKKKLEDIIEEGPKYISGDDIDREINIWKQELYSALISDFYFEKRYKTLREKTGIDVELHPAIGPVTVWHGPGPSALQQEDILKKTNVELAQYLAEFQETDHWNGPTVRGLAEILKQTVQDRPDKFVDNLKPFMKTGYLYMYYMLWGLKDAWANKKDFDWQKLFNFIKEYIKHEEFWKDELPQVGERGWSPDHETVLGELSELIKTGVRDDNREFYDVFLEDTRQILWLMIDRLLNSPIEEGEYSDYVTHALNSTWGKVIESFISLTLRIVRENKKKGEEKEIKWDNEYKKQYDALLDKGIIEAFTWLGFYLPQLHHIDKEWTKQKIVDLGERKGEKAWEAFMNGYLYGGKVYEDIYELMRPHYEYGINYNFKESHDRERLIQHISIGYLREREPLDKAEKSLFGKVLDTWDHEKIREIISYFWMQRDYATLKTEDSEKTRLKITEFWKWIFKRYQGKGSEQIDKNDKLLLSDLSKLTIFLPEINDDNFQWLIQVAPYVKEDFNSPFFIEYLDGLKDKGDKVKTADFIADIFLKMLDHCTPDYDVEHIKPIVHFLYEAGQKEKVDKICNIYGSRGFEFLRGIYDENHKKENIV